MPKPVRREPLLNLRFNDRLVQRFTRGVSMIRQPIFPREYQVQFALWALQLPDLKLMDQFGRKRDGPFTGFCLGWLEQERLAFVIIREIEANVELPRFEIHGRPSGAERFADPETSQRRQH